MKPALSHVLGTSVRHGQGVPKSNVILIYTDFRIHKLTRYSLLSNSFLKLNNFKVVANDSIKLLGARNLGDSATFGPTMDMIHPQSRGVVVRSTVSAFAGLVFDPST